MSPLAMVPISFRALLRNKLRSFLTMLGVIIGVGAVVTMTTIGEGAKQRIEDTFESMGSNMLILMSSSTRSGGVRTGAGSRQSLTWDDLKAIEAEIPSIRHIAPLLSRNTHLTSGGQNWGTSVQGTTPSYFELRNWSVLQGAFFTGGNGECAAAHGDGAPVFVPQLQVHGKGAGASAAVGQRDHNE